MYTQKVAFSLILLIFCTYDIFISLYFIFLQQTAHLSQQSVDANIQQTHSIQPIQASSEDMSRTNTIPMSTITERKGNFPCSLCKEIFVTKVALLWHSRRSHEKEKPHHCQLCMFKFATKAELKSHYKSHSDERPFQCEVCSLQFKTNKTLTRHKMVHTGERPFKCPICADSFKRKYELAHHMKKLHSHVSISS